MVDLSSSFFVNVYQRVLPQSSQIALKAPVVGADVSTCLAEIPQSPSWSVDAVSVMRNPEPCYNLQFVSSTQLNISKVI